MGAANLSGVKWPKPRKVESQGSGPPRYDFRRPHPGTDEARRVLVREGRSLDICEACGAADVRPAVHHRNGNPYDNRIENLVVLCRACHMGEHGPADGAGVIGWSDGAIRWDLGVHDLTDADERREDKAILKVTLVKGAFQCRRCNEITFVEQAQGKYSEPSACPRCHAEAGLELIVNLSTFAPSRSTEQMSTPTRPKCAKPEAYR